MRLKRQNLSIARLNCMQTSWLLTQPCHHKWHKGCFMCHWPDLQLVKCDNKSKKIEESSLPHFEWTEFSRWEQNVAKQRWGDRNPQMQWKVAEREYDVGEMTQGGSSIAAGRKGACRDYMESCHLTIWIYKVTSSHVPKSMNMVQIH